MIAAELRGGSKPSLNEALGWIGSRVDDIYGANVGRLEDVWIDPGTGAPRWLLVKEGKFGGRTTLIPFEDATAGAGHVWVPYEREVVRTAPEIASGAPLTQHVEASLRNHYAANAPASISHGPARHGSDPAVEPATIGRQQGSAMGTATVRFRGSPETGPPHLFGARGAHSQAPAQPQPVERHGSQEPHRPVIRGPQPVSRFGPCSRSSRWGPSRRAPDSHRRPTRRRTSPRRACLSVPPLRSPRSRSHPGAHRRRSRRPSAPSIRLTQPRTRTGSSRPRNRERRSRPTVRRRRSPLGTRRRAAAVGQAPATLLRPGAARAAAARLWPGTARGRLAGAAVSGPRPGPGRPAPRTRGVGREPLRRDRAERRADDSRGAAHRARHPATRATLTRSL